MADGFELKPSLLPPRLNRCIIDKPAVVDKLFFWRAYNNIFVHYNFLVKTETYYGTFKHRIYLRER